ncbi:MAG: hypothetical protein ACOYWZ_03750 [Bacillota bacterium]
MRVIIEVTGWYKRFTGGNGSIELVVKEGTRAVDAVIMTGIPREEIGFITLENDNIKGQTRLVNEDIILSEGDRLRVYPLLIGG